ncbi:hypothetical protein KUTeg_013878 [Tegillarca granosa]|uniref:Alpha-mannosidase n=1 Tax=Tegillarca granosa TaxID=220873 RepID=A0ABQ9EUZ5_TEGGR|nr:hypothetical protein KUTeg_013878 [Tegillarca granosa]
MLCGISCKTGPNAVQRKTKMFWSHYLIIKILIIASRRRYVSLLDLKAMILNRVRIIYSQFFDGQTSAGNYHVAVETAPKVSTYLIIEFKTDYIFALPGPPVPNVTKFVQIINKSSDTQSQDFVKGIEALKLINARYQQLFSVALSCVKNVKNITRHQNHVITVTLNFTSKLWAVDLEDLASVFKEKNNIPTISEYSFCGNQYPAASFITKGKNRRQTVHICDRNKNYVSKEAMLYTLRETCFVGSVLTAWYIPERESGCSWQHARMKFQQRLIIAAILSTVAVFWLIFSFIDSGLGWQKGEQDLKISYRALSLSGINISSNIDSFNLQTCSALEEISPVSNITTLDIKAKSNYVVLSNGDYQLPTLKPGNEYGPKLEPLTVIIIPHSHNDPGWLRTLEEYYVTTTKNILNNMVDKLRLYPNMTFIWAETVFLSMWWNELEDDIKVQVRRLVRRGQLEIVLGGWVMPDEASTHYYSVIDQLMEGHQWLMENLHVKPKNSWSIDPFGHSGTMPYLWKISGLENMVIQRIHQANKGVLAKNKNLEFKWRQPWDPSGKWDINCHVMPYMLYSIKHTCGPNTYVCVMFDYRHIPSDFVRPLALPVTQSNIEAQSKHLYEQYRCKASLYKYNTILVPLGDDFRYDHHQEWDQQYLNYNQLIQYMNSKKEWNIHLKFGTIKDYFKLLKRNIKSKSKINSDFNLQTLTGDFFPYSDKENAYWTGYFTTRPFDKRMSREIEANLRAADILNTLVYMYSKKWQQPNKYYHEVSVNLQNARRTLGLFLHHDAITGTSKSFVVEELEQKLLSAYNATQRVIKLAIQVLLSKSKLSGPAIFKSEITRQNYQTLALKQMVSVFESGTKVVLFNPLPHRRSELVTFVVDSDNIEIRNSNNIKIMYQINPLWSSATVVMEGLFEVVFFTDLEPLELKTFTLYKIKEKTKNILPAKITVFGTEELAVAPSLKFMVERPRHSKNYKGSIVLENNYLRVELSSVKGTLKSIYDKKSGNLTKVDLEFMFYKARGSGAYLFQPNGKAEPLDEGDPVVHVVEGPLMSSVEVIYPFLHHTVRLYNNPSVQGKGIHIQNVLNMQMKSGVMKNMEMIMRLRTSVQNKDLNFLTDQNGYQLIERYTRDSLPIEANYYPNLYNGSLRRHQKAINITYWTASWYSWFKRRMVRGDVGSPTYI